MKHQKYHLQKLSGNEKQFAERSRRNKEPIGAAEIVNANVILHNSGEENMHDSGEKSLWVSFK